MWFEIGINEVIYLCFLYFLQQCLKQRIIKARLMLIVKREAFIDESESTRLSKTPRTA